MFKLLFSTNIVFVALAFTGNSELKELGEIQYHLIKCKQLFSSFSYEFFIQTLFF